MAKQESDWDRKKRVAGEQALIVQPARIPMPVEAKQYEIDEGKWRTLVEAIFPAAKTVSGVLLAVDYCKSRNLDIMKRVVHVVPMYNAALGRDVETVWPGISEIRTTASRTKQWAGNDEVVFGPTQKRGFEVKEVVEGRGGKEGYVKEARCDVFEWPMWAQMTQYKIIQGQRVAFVGPKVLFTETFSGMKGLAVPNAMWQKRPFGQLEKCAEAASLRRAFPEEIGDQWTAEEMDGKLWMGHNGGPAIDDDAPAATEAKPTREAVKQEIVDDARSDDPREWSDSEFEAWLAEQELVATTAQTGDDLNTAWDEITWVWEAVTDTQYNAIEKVWADALAAMKAKAEPAISKIDQYRSILKANLARAELVVDVERIREGEQKNLASLSNEDRAECLAMIDARVEQLDGANADSTENDGND